MTRSYTMRGVQGTADQAVQLTRTLLSWRKPDSMLHDVQQDPRFQHRGVDLLWQAPDEAVWGVEVKGDRHARRGNYFFELISNLEKNTPGCFLYSEADWLAYAFVERREVHLLPLPAVRRWFLGCSAKFPLKHTQTRTGRSVYTTVGAVVPVREVRLALPELACFRVGPDGEVLEAAAVAPPS